MAAPQKPRSPRAPVHREIVGTTDVSAEPRSGSPPGLPRYREIYDELSLGIRTGRYCPGDRLPSEAELGRLYQTSRITIAKAVNDLQNHGLVFRRAGSGTYVLPQSSNRGHVFGLLIPDLGRTEIFEPICHGMMHSPQARTHSLLWGPAMGEEAEQEAEAEALAEQFISQAVSGIFFAPLEFTPAQDEVNERILTSLAAARIPVVLLDRSINSTMQRSRYDLVGIDNRRAGYLITSHLLSLGARRIAFVSLPRSASSVAGRIAGYREALFSYGLSREDLVRYGDPRDSAFVSSLLSRCRPDAVVCANDITAGRLMVALIERGISIPDEVRIVGFDDVKYASLLPVPLTTQHQNCGEIGSVALRTMLDRVQSPDLPVRDILIQTETIVRRSCGAHLSPRPAAEVDDPTPSEIRL